jgi:peptide subunit release factor 1 (eRF1)
MLTHERIRQLEEFEGRGARVLSVYLNTDPTRQARYSYQVVFQDLVKQAREPLGKRAREALMTEVARVQQWLETREQHGNGVALFACTPRGLWQAYYLPVSPRDHLVYDAKPDVSLLLEVVDDYERYAVALVDKERARLFTVFLGEIEESEALRDEVPGKTDVGGVSQPHFQRHHEVHVHWHLKRVAEHLTRLFTGRPFDRLVLAGPDEVTSELRRLLPRALAHRVVALIPADIAADKRDILDRTLEVERRVERKVEERLVDELFEIAGAQGRAIYGLEQTLETLWLGEVQTLVVADGADVSGSECPSCWRLAPGSVGACPACGTAMRPVPDLLHRAMGRAVEQAGSVEVVHGHAARRLLETGGGLGALLRFRLPVQPLGQASATA